MKWCQMLTCATQFCFLYNACFFGFEGLTEHQLYEFHVAAENKVGQGPWSDPSEPVMALEPGDAPTFTSSGLQNVKVVAPAEAVLGCSVNLGDPKSKVKWYYQGKEIMADKRVLIETEDQHVSLKITESKVKDSGEYSVALENKKGRVESKATLVVLGKYNFWLKGRIF